MAYYYNYDYHRLLTPPNCRDHRCYPLQVPILALLLLVQDGAAWSSLQHVDGRLASAPCTLEVDALPIAPVECCLVGTPRPCHPQGMECSGLSKVGVPKDTSPDRLVALCDICTAPSVDVVTTVTHNVTQMINNETQRDFTSHLRPGEYEISFNTLLLSVDTSRSLTSHPDMPLIRLDESSRMSDVFKSDTTMYKHIIRVFIIRVLDVFWYNSEDNIPFGSRNLMLGEIFAFASVGLACLILIHIIASRMKGSQRRINTRISINAKRRPQTPKYKTFRTNGRNRKQKPSKFGKKLSVDLCGPFVPRRNTHQHHRPHNIINIKWLIFFMVILMLIIPPAIAMPASTRRGDGGDGSGSGGGSTPNVNDFIPNTARDYDFLPGMKRWNGIPFHDFEKVWFQALIVSLGTIAMGAVTLITTAQGNDPDKAATAASDADAFSRFQQRSCRVYSCIMNYINPDCRCARFVKNPENDLINNGPGLFAWLAEYGKLEIDETTKQEMLNEWESATMEKVGIKYNPTGIWHWLEYIDMMASKIPGSKSNAQKRKKFLDGFPAWFDSAVISERLKPAPGSYVYPRTYQAPHPKAGQAHRYAGQAALEDLAYALEPEWTRRCRARNKSSYGGSAFNVHHDDDGSADDSSTTEANVNEVSRSKVTPSWICLVCGGRGHASNVDGMACLTKQLGISIPRDELEATRYPSGLKFPSIGNRGGKFKSGRKSVKHVEHDDEPSESSVDEHEGMSLRDERRPSSRRNPRDHRPRDRKKSQPRKSSDKTRRHNAKAVDESNDRSHDRHESSSSASDEGASAHFAVNFHTINTRYAQYCSMSSHESSDESQSDTKTPSSSKDVTKGAKTSTSRSATTKAKSY